MLDKKKKKPKKKHHRFVIAVFATFVLVAGGVGFVGMTTFATTGEAAEAVMNEADLELLDALQSVDPDTSPDELNELLGDATPKGNSLVFDGAGSFSWVRVQLTDDQNGVDKIQWVKLGSFAWESTPRWK